MAGQDQEKFPKDEAISEVSISTSSTTILMCYEQSNCESSIMAEWTIWITNI